MIGGPRKPIQTDIRVHPPCQTKLTQITAALNLSRLLSGPSQDRCRNRQEQSDNADNHQQFDQGESLTFDNGALSRNGLHHYPFAAFLGHIE